mgnify:FL=1|jgi:hypothetical protein
MSKIKRCKEIPRSAKCGKKIPKQCRALLYGKEYSSTRGLHQLVCQDILQEAGLHSNASTAQTLS